MPRALRHGASQPPCGCGTSRVLRAHLNPYGFGTSPARPRPQSRILVRMDIEHGQSKLVGRFAPTPSGRMHLGNIYASLLAWLSIRSANGTLLLRIEDLDERTRSGPWTSLLLDDLRWLGLYWEGDPVFQHDREELYRNAVERLTAAGLTYPCFCTRAELHAASAPHASDGTPVYAGTCRNLTPGEVAARSAVRRPQRAFEFLRANHPKEVSRLPTASSDGNGRSSLWIAEISSSGAATESSPISLPLWSTMRRWE